MVLTSYADDHLSWWSKTTIEIDADCIEKEENMGRTSICRVPEECPSRCCRRRRRWDGSRRSQTSPLEASSGSQWGRRRRACRPCLRTLSLCCHEWSLSNKRCCLPPERLISPDPHTSEQHKQVNGIVKKTCHISWRIPGVIFFLLTIKDMSSDCNLFDEKRARESRSACSKKDTRKESMQRPGLVIQRRDLSAD